MGRIVPLGTIPNSNIFPDGIFLFAVEKIEEATTKAGDNKVAKLMYKLVSKCVEPASHKGLLYFENFVIGTDDDPDAENLTTWQQSIGARAFKRFVSKSGVPTGEEEDFDTLANALTGQRYLATVVQKTEPAKKRDAQGHEYDNPYAGRVNNNTTAYWSLGEKQPATGDAPQATTTTKRTAAAKPNGQAGAVRPAPSEAVKCTACPPDAPLVPRATLKAHVQHHMDEMAATGGASADDE